jgi:sugar (pentulose or hexulose) kinase
MAAACKAPVTVMETAGEGGPYGMALLAAYRMKKSGETLEAFLADKVFANARNSTIAPDAEDVAGFDKYIEKFSAALDAERVAAVKF